MTLNYDQASGNTATDIIANANREQAKLPSVAVKVNSSRSLGAIQTMATPPRIQQVTEVTFPVVPYA
jgi:hypothetical protein